MDERHKNILQRNRTNLVKELQPSSLYDLLLEKRVFTQDMIDEIKSADTRRAQARRLVQDIETRGSRAFPLFLEILRETGHLSLAQALEDGAPQQPPVPGPQRPTVFPLVVEQQRINSPSTPTQEPSSGFTPPPEGDSLKPKVQRVRRDSVQFYKMDATPCGRCLIINNVTFEPCSKLNNRAGSNVDCARLEKRFTELNFIVDVKLDLRQKQIKHELSALSKKDHSTFDCCVVIILSHGTEEKHSRFPGAVFGVDGLSVPVQQVTNFLNGRHCPSLQGKPKLFFIQACGGGEKDTGFEVLSPEKETAPSGGGEDDQPDSIPVSSSSDSLSASDEPDARATLPTPSDILVSYSTSPGYVSWRDPKAGSWFVETLDRVLQENAASDDLATMLMMVNHEVSLNSAKGLYKQMPGSFNFLRKLLCFQAKK